MLPFGGEATVKTRLSESETASTEAVFLRALGKLFGDWRLGSRPDFLEAGFVEADVAASEVAGECEDRALFTTSLSHEVAQEAATRAPASAKHAVAG